MSRPVARSKFVPRRRGLPRLRISSDLGHILSDLINPPPSLPKTIDTNFGGYENYC